MRSDFSREIRATRVGPSFGLATLLLVVCLLGLCLGLGRVNPLLGTVAAAVLAPALIRTAEVLRQLRREGCRLGNGRKLAIFLASVLLVLATVGAALGVAIAAGIVGWLCGRLLGEAWDEPWLPVVAFAWGAVLGLPGGLTAAALIVQRWWPAAPQPT